MGVEKEVCELDIYSFIFFDKSIVYVNSGKEQFCSLLVAEFW